MPSLELLPDISSGSVPVVTPPVQSSTGSGVRIKVS